MKKLKENQKRYPKAETEVSTSYVQEPMPSENTPIDAQVVDAIAEVTESTAPKAHQETHTEYSKEEIAANEAATPTLSPVIELTVADDDLFEGATFLNAQKSSVRKVGSALAVINHKNGKRIKFSADIEK